MDLQDRRRIPGKGECCFSCGFGCAKEHRYVFSYFVSQSDSVSDSSEDNKFNIFHLNKQEHLSLFEITILSSQTGVFYIVL